MIDSHAIEAFNREVMRPVFPNWDVRSAFAITGGKEMRAGNISLHNEISNRNNIGSPYSYNKKHIFVHYTSLQNCIQIVKEKKIRLYSLKNMDDKEEFSLSSKKAGLVLSEYEDERIKEKIFCFSMSEYNNELSKNNLSLWRSFGQDGKGIGIVFSIESEKKKDWFNYTLSKVFYKEKDLDKYSEFFKRYEDFKLKHKLVINNFSALLYRYFSFHKNSIYKDEREIRLLYTCNPDTYTEYGRKPLWELNGNQTLRNYIELDLEWQFDEETRNKLISNNFNPDIQVNPIIRIEKILLGYRLTNFNFRDLQRVLFQYKNKYKEPFKIDFCGLHEHFNR